MRTLATFPFAGREGVVVSSYHGLLSLELTGCARMDRARRSFFRDLECIPWRVCCRTMRAFCTSARFPPTQS